MCGIAGFVTDGARPDRELLRMMCDRLAHRGPDSYGCRFLGPAALGHRRLSIIDLATGDQPLANEDGTIQVVFNGEIYNYLELRAELEALGHRFATRSDTEVLVHLYEEEGERMVERLLGMFAFAIWDVRRQELFLARDRFGKKPLYYSLDVPGFRIAFASELKALALLPEFPGDVNPAAVSRFLSFGYIPDPATIYRCASKLPPAHTLTLSRDGVKVRRYWEPNFQTEDTRGFGDTVEEIRSLATDAVTRRMIADVPLGAFLSGGVDSTAAVGLMANHSSAPVKTFSIGFTNPDFDELKYARMAAALHRTDHREQVVTPQAEEIFDTLASAFDEPFGDASAIPTLYLAKMTRRHVTVALSGDGADEVFGGYRRYYFGVLEERLRACFPQWFRRSVVRVGAEYYPKFDYLPQVFRAKTLLGNLSREIGDAYFTSMSIFRDESLAAILAPDLARSLGGDSPRDEFRERFSRVRSLAPLQQMQAVDFDTYLPGDILVKADRATMAYSLETRSPWLDHRLAELAGRLPAHFKLSGRRGKHVFKQAMSPWLPPAIVDRRKMGFAVPLAEWLRGPLRPLFESYVFTPEMDRWVSRDEARRLWTAHQSGLSDHSRKLWNLLVLARWDRERSRPQADRWALVKAQVTAQA